MLRAEFVDIMTRLGSPVLDTRHDNAARPVGCMMRRHLACSKTEWDGDGMVALSSKTYYCRASQGQDKLSSKGLQKKANADSPTYEAYRRVLSTGLSVVVSTAASGSDPVGKCIPIGRRGLPCLTCTSKGVWQTTVSTQSRCTCEPHTACLPACLPACLLTYP